MRVRQELNFDLSGKNGANSKMKLQQIAFGVLVAALALIPRFARAADAPANNDRLSSILIPGEDWQVVSENLGFSDGACADADGNLYFADLKIGQQAIYQVSPAAPPIGVP